MPGQLQLAAGGRCCRCPALASVAVAEVDGAAGDVAAAAAAVKMAAAELAAVDAAAAVGSETFQPQPRFGWEYGKVAVEQPAAGVAAVVAEQTQQQRLRPQNSSVWKCFLRSEQRLKVVVVAAAADGGCGGDVAAAAAAGEQPSQLQWIQVGELRLPEGQLHCWHPQQKQEILWY